MMPYHDRMPVLLMPDQFEAWLAGTSGAEALQPAAETALRAWVVSDRVNKAGQGDGDSGRLEAVA